MTEYLLTHDQSDYNLQVFDENKLRFELRTAKCQKYYWECIPNFDTLREKQNLIYANQKELTQDLEEIFNNKNYNMTITDQQLMLTLNYSYKLENDTKQQRSYSLLFSKFTVDIPKQSEILFKGLNSQQQQTDKDLQQFKKDKEESENCFWIVFFTYSIALAIVIVSMRNKSEQVQLLEGQVKNLTDDINFFLTKSQLLDQQEYKQIQNFLEEPIPTIYSKKLSLIYRSSQNNFQNDDFLKVCSNKKGPFIFVVKTQDKGIVGQYIPDEYAFQSTNKYSNHYLQERPFSFSLLDSKKNMHIKGNKAYDKEDKVGPSDSLLIQDQLVTFNNNSQWYERNSIFSIKAEKYIDFEVLQII